MTEPSDANDLLDPRTPTALSDDDLAAHLRRRSEASVPDGLAAAIGSRVAVTSRSPRWRPGLGNLRSIGAVLVAGLVIAVVAAVTVSRPGLIPGPGASGSAAASGSIAANPSASPSSSTSSPSTGSLASVNVVFPIDELLRRIDDKRIPEGSVVVADVPSSIVTPAFPGNTPHSCPMFCPTWVLHSGTIKVSVIVFMRFTGGPAPQTIGGRDAFIVLSDGSLRLLGVATTSADGRPLAGADVQNESSGLMVVHGWLAGSGPVPCPFPLHPQVHVGLDAENMQFTCPWNWIVPTANGPVQTNPDGSGSIGAAPGSLHVQSHLKGVTTVPREGVFLVRPVTQASCPPNARCKKVDPPTTAASLWEIAGEVALP